MAAEQLTWIPALRHFSMAVVWISPVYMKSMQRPVCCDARLQHEARRRVCKHTEEGRFRARELPKLIGIKRKRQIHHRSLNTQSHWWAHLIWGTSAAISKGKDPCMEEATVMVPLRLLWVKSWAQCQGMTLENRRKAKKKKGIHTTQSKASIQRARVMENWLCMWTVLQFPFFHVLVGNCRGIADVSGDMSRTSLTTALWESRDISPIDTFNTWGQIVAWQLVTSKWDWGEWGYEAN